MLLVPRPQRLEETGEGCAVDAPLAVRQVDGMGGEGFELDIDGHGVELRHSDESGRRYGEALLEQIRRQSEERLPGLRIRDWPDLPVRGFMLDISRDRVPTRETLARLVEVLALGRCNQLQLYTEHTFAYRDHEQVWRDASPMTPGDLRWLDELCAGAGIELVANQNTFGHMARWLAHPAYRHRAEAPDGFDLFPGMPSPPTTLAPTPENAEFALGLVEELLTHFTSRRVNVGCDETFELGRGVSRAEAERRGKTAVFADHLVRILEPLCAQGLEVQFWADMVRHDPSVVDRLPAGAVAVAWTYEAPRPESERPEVPESFARVLAEAGIDLAAHNGFAANVEPIAATGYPFWLAAGTSSWNSLVGRIDNAIGNVLDAVETAKALGAGGVLFTDWGDNGHLQPPSVSFGPALFGGSVAWALDANRDLDLPAVLDRFVFDDPTATLGGLFDRAGRWWNQTGQRAFNASPLQAALGQAHLVTGQPDRDGLAGIVEQCDDALVALERPSARCADGDVVRQEMTAAVRLARHGAYRLSASVGGSAPDGPRRHHDLLEARELQRAAWLARSRPGGLADSLRLLDLPTP